MITDARQLEGDIRELEGLEIRAERRKRWWTATVYVAANTSLGRHACHGKAERTFLGAVEKAIRIAKKCLKADPSLQE